MSDDIQERTIAIANAGSCSCASAELALRLEREADLAFVRGDQWSAQDRETGIAVRFLRQWDIAID